MATSICTSSSSSITHQTILRPKKLNEQLINGVSSVSSSSSPFISFKKTSVLPIRCRFIRSYRNSGYSLRRAGMASNLEATTTTTGAPTSVPVRVAHELLQAGHHYLDVRTPEEFSAGHVPGAVNIPYMLRVGSGMTKNSKFHEQVSSQFGKDDEILVACQSGKRSLMTVNDLQSAGYTGIVDVSGGYGAWIQSELPTEM